MPYPAGYGFPLPFDCRHSLLDPSLSRWRFGPSLRLAYCQRTADSIGVYTFRMREIRFGVGLSYAPGPLVFALKIMRFLRPDVTQYQHINQGFC
jgi:hypothetical protein